MVRVSLGYPTADEETDDARRPRASATACSTWSPWPTWARCSPRRRPPARVHGSEALRRYIVALLEATRADPRVELGASPRAGLMLFRAAKALAGARRRATTRCPDDVQALAAVGAEPPAAARARVAAATSGPPSCGTRSTGFRPSEPRPPVMRAIATALLGVGLCAGGRHLRLALALRARRGAGGARCSARPSWVPLAARGARRSRAIPARRASWRTSPTRCGWSCAPACCRRPAASCSSRCWAGRYRSQAAGRGA